MEGCLHTSGSWTGLLRDAKETEIVQASLDTENTAQGTLEETRVPP